MHEEGGVDEADLEIVEDADAAEEGAAAGGEGSDLKNIGCKLPIERAVVNLLYSLVHCRLSFSSCLLKVSIPLLQINTGINIVYIGSNEE